MGLAEFTKSLFDEKFSSNIDPRILIGKTNIIITTYYFNIDLARECLTLEESKKLKESLLFWKGVPISFFILDNEVRCNLPSYVGTSTKSNSLVGVLSPAHKDMPQRIEAKASHNKKLKEILKTIELKAILSGEDKQKLIEIDIYISSELNIFLNNMAKPIINVLQEKMDLLINEVKEAKANIR